MTEKNRHILCIGAANVDHTFKPVSTLKSKNSNPITSVMSYGGVIRNVAENLAHLNSNVSLMSLIGNDVIGKTLLLDMNKMIDTKSIDILNGKRTGQYYAVLDASGDMDIAYADMSIYEHMNADWIHQKQNMIIDHDLIIADMNLQKDGIAQLIELAKNHDLKLVLVGVSETKMSHLPKNLDGVEMIICNREEAKTFFHTENCSDQDLINQWFETGLKKVIMTNSQKDVLYVNDDYQIKRSNVKPIEESKYISATGAGDAFSAGVIYGMIKGLDVKGAIAYGKANANLTIQSQYSVRPDLSEEKLSMEVTKGE